MWEAADRRPWLALVLLCLCLYLPGVFTIPPVDRDEPRFAQATKQMLETRDFVAIRFQDTPRNKKPVGIYWMQAATAALFSGERHDRIWAYRLPSLIGACTAVLLTYWAGLPLFGRRASLIGAALFASCLLLGVEARLAKTDAVLLATIVAAQGVLARLYVGAAGERSLYLALAFWAALGAGVLVKGPMAPLVLGLTVLALVAWDRRAAWLKELKPLLGVPLMLLIVSPWAIASWLETRGHFFSDALTGDLLPKLLGAQEAHGAPPGFYLVAAVVTFWSGALFFLPATVHAFKFRHDARFRFALAWAVPTWLVLEIVPTKLPHYVLPTFPALALLMGAVIVANEESVSTPLGRIWGKIAIGLWALTALALALAIALLRPFVQGAMSVLDFGLASVVYAIAAITIWYALEGRHAAAAAGAVMCSVVLSLSLFGLLAPQLNSLWVSKRLVEALPRAEDGSLPRLGASGFSEPSLVFLAGTETLLAPPQQVAAMISANARRCRGGGGGRAGGISECGADERASRNERRPRGWVQLFQRQARFDHALSRARSGSLMAPTLRHALFIIGAITALRLAALYFSAADLGPDEAQYWVWAQSPSFGYFSKPPLIAWIIAATTFVCGDGEACVRLASPLLHGATALVLFLVARALYDARIGLLSAFAYLTLPGVSLSAELITTDVPLLFFWALALLAVAKGMTKPTFAAAFLLGISLGLGLLAKYAMMYFVLSAAVAAFALPKVREFLVSWRGALAGLLAAAIVAPNVVWNLTNGLATLRHTAANADLSGTQFDVRELAKFLLGQVGVFGPIFFVALAIGLFPTRQPRAAAPEAQDSEATRFLVCFTVPTLAVGCVIAFVSRAHANWAAPAYVAATPLVLHWLVAARRKLLLRLSLALHVIVAVILPVGAAVPALADGLGLGNVMKRLRGWDELGRAVAGRLGERAYTAILTGDRELMGELLYYAQPRQIPVVMWDWPWPPRNHYEMRMRIDAVSGERVLFVSTSMEMGDIFRRFKSVEPLGEVTVALDLKRFRTTYLYALEGYEPRAP